MCVSHLEVEGFVRPFNPSLIGSNDHGLVHLVTSSSDNTNDLPLRLAIMEGTPDVYGSVIRKDILRLWLSIFKT
jgi:hypothetical protein